MSPSDPPYGPSGCDTRFLESTWRYTMKDIITGVVLIAIGLFMGSSFFFGDFTLFNIFFDGLGVFFIGKGVFGMMGPNTG
jgi:hypothetical protein